MRGVPRCIEACALLAGAAALTKLEVEEKGTGAVDLVGAADLVGSSDLVGAADLEGAGSADFSGMGSLDFVAKGSAKYSYNRTVRIRQTPEELGFTSEGDPEFTGEQAQFHQNYCLDLGAKGFPLPTFDMLQRNQWSASSYFEQLQTRGYAEDALQMTGPQEALLSGSCARENFRSGKVKHIFVGDSQMMVLRNAFHRLHKCPEVWWSSQSEKAVNLRKALQARLKKGRLHSLTDQSPLEILPEGCQEEGIASYIYWDAWAHRQLPVDDIKKEMEQLQLDPKDGGDTVVVWVGSNFINAERRMTSLLEVIDELHSLGVKMVWDSPTFQDTAIMAATSTEDHGIDKHTRIPTTYTSIQQRKTKGELGSNQYKTEKTLFDSGLEIPVTRRWQLTNRYRGLQCDGMHTDMRGRDPLFYPAPGGRCAAWRPHGLQPGGALQLRTGCLGETNLCCSPARAKHSAPPHSGVPGGRGLDLRRAALGRGESTQTQLVVDSPEHVGK
ncbi:unnamed protein product [Prorocentrum cordatum]|uniref:Uncharacterized protein n=1 Tax=Prorocentrum cordatum TaxID=2364126 RepID=A0ABN9WKD5_9DINO|nr:unnamed protein product [Polarella glacialis]